MKGQSARRPGFRRRATFHIAARAAAPYAASGFVASAVLFNGFDSTIGKGIVAIEGGVLLAIVLIGRQPSRGEWRQALPVIALLGAALLWALMIQLGLMPNANVPVPIAPDLFAPALAGALGAIATLLAGYFLGHGDQQVLRTLNMLMLMLCGALAAALYWSQPEAPKPFDYWVLTRQGRLTGTAGNANVTATIAGVALLLALGSLARRLLAKSDAGRPRFRRFAGLGYGVLLFIAAAALALTGSRFAAVATLLLAAPLLSAQLQRWRRGRLVAIGAVLLLAALFAFGAQTTITRFADVDNASVLRLKMGQHYLQLAAASPWWGYGLGSFPALNAWTLNDVPTASMLWTINSPHNVLLQLQLDGGFVYLSLILGAVVSIAITITRHFHRSFSDPTGMVLLCALSLTLAVAMIDIPLDYPATVMLTTLLAGLAWGRASAPYRGLLGTDQAPAGG